MALFCLFKYPPHSCKTGASSFEVRRLKNPQSTDVMWNLISPVCGNCLQSRPQTPLGNETILSWAPPVKKYGIPNYSLQRICDGR